MNDSVIIIADDENEPPLKRHRVEAISPSTASLRRPKQNKQMQNGILGINLSDDATVWQMLDSTFWIMR
jgi:hypothetical protein